jgi:hypothetical protein
MPSHLLHFNFSSPDWPSFFLIAGACCEHSIVSPLLQTFHQKGLKALQNTFYGCYDFSFLILLNEETSLKISLKPFEAFRQMWKQYL